MTYELTKEAEIENLGVIKYIDAPIDEGLELITSKGGELISARNLAFARIHIDQSPSKAVKHSLSQYGSRIKEGDLYVQRQGIFLLRNSLLLQSELAKEATQAHRDNMEYFISGDLAKEYTEKASDEQNSEVFPLTDTDPIRTNKFDTDKRALWLFGDQAENYGKFLYNNSITEMPLFFDSRDYINKQTRPYTSQLWLRWLAGGDRSSLFGDVRGLIFGGRLRGVFPKTAEGGSQKFSEEKSELLPYTTKQLNKTIQIIRDVKEGRTGTSDLKEALNFLDSLPRKQ